MARERDMGQARIRTADNDRVAVGLRDRRETWVVRQAESDDVEPIPPVFIEPRAFEKISSPVEPNN